MANATEVTHYGDKVTARYRERDGGATQIFSYEYHATGLKKLFVTRGGQQVKFFSNNPGTAVVERLNNA
jgi:hypothetical protein